MSISGLTDLVVAAFPQLKKVFRLSVGHILIRLRGYVSLTEKVRTY